MWRARIRVDLSATTSLKPTWLYSRFAAPVIQLSSLRVSESNKRMLVQQSNRCEEKATKISSLFCCWWKGKDPNIVDWNSLCTQFIFGDSLTMSGNDRCWGLAEQKRRLEKSNVLVAFNSSSQTPSRGAHSPSCFAGSSCHYFVHWFATFYSNCVANVNNTSLLWLVHWQAAATQRCLGNRTNAVASCGLFRSPCDASDHCFLRSLHCLTIMSR